MTDIYKTSTSMPDCLTQGIFVHPQDEPNSAVQPAGYKLPGIIDCHIHGAFGWDFSFAEPQKIENLLDQLVSAGLTGVFPTLITCSEEQRLLALADLALVAKKRRQLPIIHGIYLEGPFLAPARRGSHPEHFLQLPAIKLLQKWQRAADGLIKVVTVAPELPGALEFIAQATAMGVTVALGHSEADWETTEKAIAAGARQVTHIFNAMPPLHHRQPGLLSFILSQRDLSVEVIGDCEHLSPETIKMLSRIHENNQLIFVSDAVAAAGLSDGQHNLYDTQLQLHSRRCCLPNGNLFGGATLLPECMKLLKKQARLPWGLIGTAMWRTPCQLMHIAAPDTEVFFDRDLRWLASRYEQTWYSADKNV